MKYLSLLLTIFLSYSCARGPQKAFDQRYTSIAPNYADTKNWAALPTKDDNADKTPAGLTNQQNQAVADVFYVHPTMYYGKRSYKNWNASLNNIEVNKDVDNTAVLYQGSCFNAAGRVYAPRYRQAHIKSYGHEDQASAQKAFEVAYSDVKAAFEYYIKNWNEGRPFIIASHSQGTTHCQRLIKELIDGTPLQDLLVVGYLIGIPVDIDQYTDITPCEDEDQVGCIVGWRTFKKGYLPPSLVQEEGYNVLITNPLSWTTNTTLAPKTMNKGAVLTDFYANPKPELVNAQINGNILWCNKPKFRGSWLLTFKNYHRGDINLFYVNIRENAEHRVQKWLQNHTN